MKLVTRKMILDALQQEIIRMRNAGNDAHIALSHTGDQQYTMIAGGYADLTNVADNLNRLLSGESMQ